MQITSKSELMKNQKHAEVLSPTKTFDVLQTPEGGSIFFSIGTDDVFYATREVNQTQTGWSRVDLSSPISALHKGTTIVVKTFALAQNPKTQMFDAAVVVTVLDQDLLYMSTNHSNTAADWASGIAWTEIPFDAVGITPPNPLVISDVYLMAIADSDDASQPGTLTCFVDVIRNTSDPQQLLDRYYVMSSGVTRWMPHPWAANLRAGHIDSCLGRREGDRVPGIYTFGTLGETPELIFVPEYNFFNQRLQPLLARLQLPAQPGAITAALNSSGCSNLFVAAASGLYVFSPGNQHDEASGTLVVPSSVVGGVDMFANITSLSAYTVGNKTVVWALGEQGQLFHTDCTAGEEAMPSSWSTPVPFSTNVNQFAFFLNATSTNIVLFIYSSGQDILQFTQQPSGEWVQRSILMPPSDSSKYVEFTSFTTRIAVQDDNGSPVPFQSINLTSEVPVSVYINDTYHVLSPTAPTPVETDSGGSVTVIQETNTLGAVKLTGTINGPSSVSSTIDPLVNASVKLQSIQAGDDLANITVTADDGSQKPLIPSTVSSGTRDSAAQAIGQLMQAKAGIDAKKQANSTVNGTSSTTASAKPPSQSPMVAPSAPAFMSLVTTPAPSSTVDLIGHSIKLAAEDFFQFFRNVGREVSQFVVHCVGDAWHFVAMIGETIYHAVLDTVVAVTNAVEFVFNKLEVAFEDLVRWLGFLFSWEDIKRSHTVMKSFVKGQIQHFIDSMDTMSTNLNTFFVDAENIVNEWADVTDPGESVGSQQKQNGSAQGSDSPQSHWALYHTQNGTSSAQVTSSAKTEGTVASVGQAVLDLEALVIDQIDDVKTVVTQIKDQIIDHIHDLTPIEIIKKLLAFAGDLVLKTTKDILATALSLFKLVVQEALGMLDSPLDIPILSQIYKFTTGDDLTIIDLVCLVSAIPATIVYKIACGAAPFPDDAAVQSYTGPGSTQLVSLPVLDSIPTTSLDATAASPTATSAQPPASDPFYKSKIFFNYSTIGSGALVALLSVPKREYAIDLHNSSRSDPKPAPSSTSEEKEADSAPAEEADGGSPEDTVEGTAKRLGVAKLLKPKPKNKWVNCGYASAYLLYMIPNFLHNSSPGWWQTVNITVAALDAIKVLADSSDKMDDYCPKWSTICSPFMDTLINIIWVIPAGVSYAKAPQKTKEELCGMIANLFFDAGGILSPLTSPFIFDDPEVNLAAFIVTLGTIFGYVGSSVATAVAIQNS